MSKPSLKRQLRGARPDLKLVAPLPYWVLVVMAVFNICLGLTLLFLFDTDRLSASLIIVNDTLSSKMWGLVFIGIGLFKLYALHINSWSLARKSLLVGVAIKAIWAVVLIFRVFISPGSLFLTLCWLCIAALQMSTYIFFMPTELLNAKKNADR